VTESGCVQVISAHSPNDLPVVRELFQEYADSLRIDLCFQNFREELATLPGKYAPPAGCLLLAKEEQTIAGCVGVRAIGPGIAEMKRLYVRPAFRRTGLGRLLAQSAIEAARSMGYSLMQLDTLAIMREAIALYESLGFQKIPPYYDNPSEYALFFELIL
jgi:ribosomal protein S18 acetylase RimI-like enzyme